MIRRNNSTIASYDIDDGHSKWIERALTIFSIALWLAEEVLIVASCNEWIESFSYSFTWL